MPPTPGHPCPLHLPATPPPPGHLCPVQQPTFWVTGQHYRPSATPPPRLNLCSSPASAWAWPLGFLSPGETERWFTLLPHHHCHEDPAGPELWPVLSLRLEIDASAYPVPRPCLACLEDHVLLTPPVLRSPSGLHLKCTSKTSGTWICMCFRFFSPDSGLLETRILQQTSTLSPAVPAQRPKHPNPQVSPAGGGEGKAGWWGSTCPCRSGRGRCLQQQLLD